MARLLARILIFAAASIVFALNAADVSSQGYPERPIRIVGGVATPASPEELRSQVETEISRWQRIVETRKIERQ